LSHKHINKLMRTNNKLLVIILCLLAITGISAKEYNASFFGIKQNGTTMNTSAIQRAIDYIHAEGGGTLVFAVGRYLTGTIYLKSDVTLRLKEGAVIVGSLNPYDYNVDNKLSAALIYAEGQNNIGIVGQGVIDGRGRELAYNIQDQIQKGVLKDELKNDRPGKYRPKCIYLRECKNVEIKGIFIKNSCEWVQTYDQCEQVKIDSISVESNAFWNNDGIDIVDCKHLKLLNSYVSAADDAICLKSHDAKTFCDDVEIRNCTARSGASGIKFGTVTSGGYKNIRIINNKVYDTFRSAITIATPDGGNIENVVVDSLKAYHTGNAIFLRICNRWTNGRPVGIMNNITISNMYAEIAADKPDAGYDYEGPTEDQPRNITPAAIMGIEGHDITNVTLKNIHLVFPGGGNPHFAYRGTKPADLDSIPEMEAKYPEFSQFKELPAWGFYIRHAQNVKFENVTLTAKETDYRPAIVIQQAKNISLKKVKYVEPGKKKQQVVKYKTN